jgi:hypothetical protein
MYSTYHYKSLCSTELPTHKKCTFFPRSLNTANSNGKIIHALVSLSMISKISLMTPVKQVYEEHFSEQSATFILVTNSYMIRTLEHYFTAL